MTHPDQTCELCGTHIKRPYPEHGNYIVSDEFTEPEPVEVHYALVHTEETKRLLNKMDRLLPDRDRDAINAEMAHPDAPDTIEVPAGTKTVENDNGNQVTTADRREFPFSVPVEKFQKVEVDDPHLVAEDDDVAIVLTEQEERDRQKTGFVCHDCTPTNAEIIWGVDAE